MVKVVAGVIWCLVLDRSQRILFIRFILCTVILHCQAYPSAGLIYALYAHHFLAVRLAGSSQGVNQIECLHILERKREKETETEKERERETERETEREREADRERPNWKYWK